MKKFRSYDIGRTDSGSAAARRKTRSSSFGSTDSGYLSFSKKTKSKNESSLALTSFHNKYLTLEDSPFDDRWNVLHPSPGYFDKQFNDIRVVYKDKVMDIVGCLWKMTCSDALRIIFTFMSAKDLVNMRLVSQRWNSIVSFYLRERRHRKLVKKASRRIFKSCSKENLNEDVSQPTHSPSVKSILLPASTNLSEPVPKPQIPKEEPLFDLSPIKSPTRKYCKMSCPRCRRTCTCDVTYNKGKCLYAKCRFEFCIRCNCAYHPLKGCKVTRRMQQLSPIGSKRSKDYVRRLCL